MSVSKCDYQLIPPTTESYSPAPVHPDPAVAARIATVATASRGRRFALCQVIPARPDSTEVLVRPMYQGIQNPDGTCVLLLAGQPYGYYQSIDAAYHHTGRDDLYLSWAEPDPALPDSARNISNVEARENDATYWLVALPFIAHGPTDARTKAIDTATHLEPVTPGLIREATILLSGDNPTNPITLFCPIEPCMREPFHHGDHQPAPETEPQGETEPESGSEPIPGPDSEYPAELGPDTGDKPGPGSTGEPDTQTQPDSATNTGIEPEPDTPNGPTPAQSTPDTPDVEVPQ